MAAYAMFKFVAASRCRGVRLVFGHDPDVTCSRVKPIVRQAFKPAEETGVSASNLQGTSCHAPLLFQPCFLKGLQASRDMLRVSYKCTSRATGAVHARASHPKLILSILGNHRAWSRAKCGHRTRPCCASSAWPTVVGVGGVGIDYLASVANFPKPDQKMRTENLEIQGGGNCGNALTGLSRLGVNAKVFSAIGDDAFGDAVREELEQDGVDVTFLQSEAGSATPFTFIIVDRLGALQMPITILVNQLHVSHSLSKANMRGVDLAPAVRTSRSAMWLPVAVMPWRDPCPPLVAQPMMRVRATGA
jgi:hypothetical protein